MCIHIAYTTRRFNICYKKEWMIQRNLYIMTEYILLLFYILDIYKMYIYNDKYFI